LIFFFICIISQQLHTWWSKWFRHC